MTTRRLAILFAVLISGCSYLPNASVDANQSSTIQIAGQESLQRAEIVEQLNKARINLSKYTPPPSLLETAIQGFTWPTYGEKEEVTYWINRYLKDRDQFEEVLARAEPYLYYILKQLEENDLPPELAFLPFVESGFRPDVDSWIGAAGLWQFMPATGRYLGLEQDWWVDERRSVDNSTGAALRYLSYLHNCFDQDWFMALAAYNTGEGNLGKAIRARPDSDYWGLQLNSETASFVPKLLAVIYLLKNANSLDLYLPYWPNQPHFETYEANRQLDLEAVARNLQLDDRELLVLNAHYPQAITPPNHNARILLPIGEAKNLASIIESLPEVTGPSWAHYKVHSGDNISVIADHMGVSVRAVMEANQLSSHLIYPGDDLLIPSPTRVQPDPTIAGSVALVRPGDSIWLIAHRYGVSISALLAANGLSADDFIYPGQTLKLPVEREGEGDFRLTHEVRSGDSLYDIAALYGVRLTELKRWNSLGNSNLIRPGDQLTIWQAVD